MNTNNTNDNNALIAIALFLANLLFVVFFGILYIALWVLYLRRYADATPITQNHMKQALIASSISTAIFVGIILFFGINLFSLASGGGISISLPALISLELYFMLVVPAFLVVGIFALTRATRNEDFRYPLIGRFVGR